MRQLVQGLTDPNNYILVQTPVYGPFRKTILHNQHQVLENFLELTDDRYHINFDSFTRIIKEKQPKIFILCNPHNPGGIVWTKEELTKMVNICAQYNLLIISDEVHSDLTFTNYQFYSLLLFSSLYDNIIICNSPIKLLI
ncbi:hypothetical protein P344_01985 [Spiroplasma mirum ATCC 29335]|uniref:cysteine-S-conjugate beta-lyase n=1 Tax=Spiroplasma mirum ATCC 29335 TaxID=838561 RepID=W0GNZ2_9MOLU|nr:aminotransferase [Spiroplasma mirum ATCC 29335]AHI57745.1 hypothetical protein P344_01985 [Spiroplasma mirum ATCC 29335]